MFPSPLRPCRRPHLHFLIAVLMSLLLSGRPSEAFNLSLLKRESRYFVEHLEAPPLEALEEFPIFASDTKYHCSLPIVYTNDPKVVSEWLQQHVKSGCAIGFDTESVPDAPWVKQKANFVGPATVQLSTIDACLVVQLARKSGRPSKACGPILDAVIGDKSIIKAGCGIDDDLIELREQWSGLEGRSRLELGGVGASRGETLGLKRLLKHVFGLHLAKSKRLATSNWSQVPLDESQLVYCARDAWAGAAIADKLACLDPDTFGAEALMGRLQSQRSLKELSSRRRKRKQAKKLLSSLLSPYTVQKKEKLPSWKAKVVKELKSVMRENQADRGDVYDVRLLGLAIPSSNSASG